MIVCLAGLSSGFVLMSDILAQNEIASKAEVRSENNLNSLLDTIVVFLYTHI
jgi:hypothetical protein